MHTHRFHFTPTHRALAILLTGLLLASLVGCSLTSNLLKDTIVITATPQPGEVIRPYVTPTTASYAYASHTELDSHPLLNAGLWHLQFGQYQAALESFQSASSDSDPDVRASAAFNIARTYQRAGEYGTAVSALTSFVEGFPGDDRVPNAYFMRGDAYTQFGQWQAAIDDYATYYNLRPGIIDSYVFERMADAYFNLGDTGSAQDYFIRAAAAPRVVPENLWVYTTLQDRAAVLYANAGQYDAAVALYDNQLFSTTDDDNSAYIIYQSAKLLEEYAQLTGDTTLLSQAYPRYERLVDEYPTSYYAFNALEVLLPAGYDIPFDQRGTINYNAGLADVQSQGYYFNLAVDDFDTYLVQSGNVAPAEIFLMQGRAYRGLGRHTESFRAFQNVIDQVPPSNPAYGEAWLAQGRTLYQQGRTEDAATHYVALADQHPDLPAAAEALARAGYIYAIDQDNVVQANETFERLARDFPDSPWTHSSYQAEAYLHLGRMLESGGQTDEANEMYARAADANPGSYESARAADLLHNRTPFTPPAQTTIRLNDQTGDVVATYDLETERKQAEDWLRERFGLSQSEALYPLSSDLLADPLMIRGRELLLMDDFTHAGQEFEGLRVAYSDNPLATYQLAVYFRDARLYRLSIFAAADLIISAEATNFDAPPYLVRLRYPVYYAELVLPWAGEYQLDPLLVFSLIRQESFFESYATSFAAAQGLMQVIPSTAAEIAGDLGEADFQPTDIYYPYVNVRFGTYYLWETLDYVGGKDVIYAALAGYNGGPYRALQWLESSGQDIDTFIATVTEPETRAYVTRIYQQYAVYRNLYGTSGG
ncbi:MAG: tetratricopeptide repeat protein [Chloroflexi bacterium]|nr:tetratricopeptide repeat protein [Chloroflexota bacterium]